MKKLMVYPLTRETMPLLRYSAMLSDYDQVISVIEKGSGALDDKNIAYIDGGTKLNTKVFSDFQEALPLADDVLFSSEVYDVSNCLKNFKLSKEAGKNIIVDEEFSAKLDIDCSDCTILHYQQYSSDVKSDQKLLKIPVPTVLVIGQGQNCNKFDIQMALRAKFQELGYKSSQVGTKYYSALFGCHTLPLLPDEPLWRKIMLYNRYFKEIVDKEKPDVLIVGAPGGTMPIDKWNNELFGETAIAISKSLEPDASVFSLYMTEKVDDLCNRIIEHSRYALGAPVDCFHISNTRLFFEQDMRTISYLSTDYSKALKGLSAGDNVKLFNVFIKDSLDDALEGIVEQLQNNIEVL